MIKNLKDNVFYNIRRLAWEKILSQCCRINFKNYDAICIEYQTSLNRFKPTIFSL